MIYFCARCGVAIEPWGRRSCCPPCAIIKYKASRAAWYERNREEIRAQRAQFRKLNRDKISTVGAAYYRKNKERLLEYQRAYRAKHKHKISARDKSYYAKNKDWLNQMTREYKRTNPHITRSSNARRRAAKKSCANNLPYKGYEKDLLIEAKRYGRCPLCNSIPKQWHLEHAQPLSRDGKHEIGNLYYCCATCNVRKCSKTLEEFCGITIKDIPYNIYLSR